MLPVFSWQITSTSKDKGTHYLYMVKGPALHGAALREL